MSVSSASLSAEWPLVAIVPVLERPWRAQPLADSFRAATPHGRLLFVASSTDRAEIEACEQSGSDVLVVPGPRRHGDWARKINAGYRASTEPLMLLGGDDITFRAGWHDEVANAAAQGWDVIGTQDLGSPRVMQGTHSTHPVVTRRYADEQGTLDRAGEVVTERYDHNYVDDELVGTAKHRGVWVFCSGAVVEHLHPSWRKADIDHVYQLGRQMWHADQNLHLARRYLWGG